MTKNFLTYEKFLLFNYRKYQSPQWGRFIQTGGYIIAHYIFGIRMRSLIFRIRPCFIIYQKTINLSNFQFLKLRNTQKLSLKIVLILLFDDSIPKRYQKVPNCINQRIWPNGFCHPLRPLCTGCFLSNDMNFCSWKKGDENKKQSHPSKVAKQCSFRCYFFL